MKIPQQLYQFNDTLACIIVTGTAEAVVYSAQDGSVEKQFSYKSEKEFGDLERSTNTMKGGGRVIAHSIPVDDKQEKERKKTFKELLKELTVEVSSSTFEDAEFFIFAPDTVTKDVCACIPKGRVSSVKSMLHGNFVHEHPLELVKKIDQLKKGKKVTPTGKEAAKILKKGSKNSTK